jgi:hypothetical protein
MDIEHNTKIVRRLLDEVVGQGDIAVVGELDPCRPAPADGDEGVVEWWPVAAPPSERELAETFAEISQVLLGERDVQHTLEKMCELLVLTVVGCDHAVVTVVRDHHLSSPASSDDVTDAGHPGESAVVFGDMPNEALRMLGMGVRGRQRPPTGAPGSRTRSGRVTTTMAWLAPSGDFCGRKPPQPPGSGTPPNGAHSTPVGSLGAARYPWTAARREGARSDELGTFPHAWRAEPPHARRRARCSCRGMITTTTVR